MAEHLPGEGSSHGNAVSGESSDSILELNVKTLDSRMFHFQVEKNVQVSVLKEKIANDVGLSAGQQRLIFRGKVLKDDHLLSQYHVENGDTLHLVERQPTQPQPSSGSGSGETASNIGNQGNNANAGAPRGRVGQISHSVVLGTFNIGDQGESIGPDISQFIGTVLNSIGLGNLAQANAGGNRQSPVSLNVPGQGLQGNGTEGLQGNVSVQSHIGNQPSVQSTPNMSFQSLPQVVQIPLAAAAVPVPSLNSPIPDSLNTLLEFMNRMEQTLSRNVNQQNPSTSSVESPPSSRGLPTPEALSIVLRRAEQLLSGLAVSALSHIAGRLEQEGSSSDPSIRSQIQTESSQTGIAMQHLGALFLEIGRTMLTLRMGQSPGEAFVNAGPAVYISPSGPNPIMVQPFHLQTHSLFGGSVPPVNPVAFGPVGVGNPPRHINIHIHAGTSLAPVVSATGSRLSTGDGAQGERGNSDSSQDAVTTHPLRNVISTTGSSNPSSVLSSTVRQPIPVSGSAHPELATPLSSVIAEINSQIRSLVSNIQDGNQAPSGQATTSVQAPVGSASAHEQPNLVVVNASVGPAHSSTESVLESADKSYAESSQTMNLEDSRDHVNSRDASGPSGDSMPSLKSEGASSSNGSRDAREGTNSTPLGLGLGGLERKKRAKQPKPQPKGGDGGPTDTVPERKNVQTSGQQLLQSLLSHGSTSETTDVSTKRTESSPAMGQARDSNTSPREQVSESQFNAAGMMSQVLQSPALNGLLSGVSEQTGVGSPDVLRNMLQQFTQSPVMMNTVSRIAQQVDSQDLGSMFAGLGGGQGGGGRIDLSRMVQQMMPIVSQALGGGPSGTESLPSAADHEIESQPSEMWHNPTNQAELGGVVRDIESRHSPRDIFHSMVESAVQASGNRSSSQDLLDTLCSDAALANEYEELLSRDLSRRLQGDYGTED